jgi:pimeloyl-ACP methyl ester carboxylesterase
VQDRYAQSIIDHGTMRVGLIILVGHSYGGMVVTGVADSMTDRISALVYLDAFLPTAGKSFHDILPPEVAEAQASTIQAVAARRMNEGNSA